MRAAQHGQVVLAERLPLGGNTVILDNRTLEDNRAWPWMEGEPLWYLIAENSYLHEREHAQDIRLWRQREGL